MSAWNFMSYESKGNLLEAVRREAAGMFALAEEPEIWMAPTGAGHWQVRDVFGHLIDTTETYFVGFDAARKGTSPPESAPLRDMATHVDQGAQQFRTLERKAVLDRLGSALDRMFGITEDLTEEDWAGLSVPHKYMGPLPAFFYRNSSWSTMPCTAGTSGRASESRTRWRPVRRTFSYRCVSCSGRRPRSPGRKPSRSSSGSGSPRVRTPATRASRSAPRASRRTPARSKA